MKRKNHATHIFLIIMILSDSLLAQKTVNIDWSVFEKIPSLNAHTVQPGLAGAISGIVQNTLLIAGGANFPDKMPWAGGVKKYHYHIYLLALNESSDHKWIITKNTLPANLAYSATIAYQNRLIILGGENENGISDKVWDLRYDPGTQNLNFTELPGLPLPLTNLAAALVNHTIFIAGGESTDLVSDKLFSLDLLNTQTGWKEHKNIPHAVSHTLLLSVNGKKRDDLYLIGGRKKNPNGISTLYRSVYAYQVQKNKWKKKSELPHALSAHSGVNHYDSKLLIIGGDKGDTFSAVEKYLATIQSESNPIKKQELMHNKNQLQIQHPGFSNAVLAYDLKKNKWAINSKIPFTVPVTTQAHTWNNKIIIPSGEIKAGVRTPDILMGKLEQE